jgi:hypothetical protein
MKYRTLLLLGASVVYASGLSAQPIFMDFGTAPSQSTGSTGTTPIMGGDIDTFTKVFQQLGLFADTTTVQFDTDGSGGLNVGDKFLDSGTASVTSLLPPLGDDEGLGFLSELTVSWAGLSGSTTSPLTAVGPGFSQNIAYDSANTTFSFYFHGDAFGPDGAPNADFGTDIGSFDNSGFSDGEKVLEIAITGGQGANSFNGLGDFVSGSSVLNGEIIFALDDFWWFDNGDAIPGTAGDKDFTDLLGLMVPITLKSKIDQNTDEVAFDPSIAGAPGPLGFGDALFAVHSTHDGSINFAIPAPATLLLLGLGCLMLPWVRRKYGAQQQQLNRA